jgi:threonine/homoserine/homoserine lactone efflux protein
MPVMPYPPDTGILFRGFLLGFSIAAPVGPIGVLCIRRTLAQGLAAGLVSGLGAATADAIYGSIAAFGVTAVSTVLVSQQSLLRVFGGLFLCYLGFRTLIARPTPAGPEPATERVRLPNAYLSTFILTLTNPLTILFFAGVFAAMGLGAREGNYTGSALLVLGVFTGSASWWLALSSVTSLARGKVSQRGLLWVNRISGVVIIGFGVVALASPIA